MADGDLASAGTEQRTGPAFAPLDEWRTEARCSSVWGNGIRASVTPAGTRAGGVACEPRRAKAMKRLLPLFLLVFLAVLALGAVHG